MGVEQTEIADLEKERQDRRRERKGQSQDKVVEQQLLAEEL